MQHSFTYRRVLSAVFLLLYVFIATPIQLWHHHQFAKTDSKSVVKTSTENAGLQSEDCAVCKHTYAAYFTNDTRYTFSSTFLFPVYKTHYSLYLLSPTLDDTSNKSPPAIQLT